MQNGTLAFPARRDIRQPILDLLRDGPRSSRELENSLAEQFGLTMEMRTAKQLSGCPAWRNHVAWTLVDLSSHRTGEIERIESKPAPDGGSMGIYRLTRSVTPEHSGNGPTTLIP